MVDQRVADVAALRDRAGRRLATDSTVATADLPTPSPGCGRCRPATLQPGYAIVQRADGQVVRSRRST